MQSGKYDEETFSFEILRLRLRMTSLVFLNEVKSLDIIPTETRRHNY
jgi:hypothetical protein